VSNFEGHKNHSNYVLAEQATSIFNHLSLDKKRNELSAVSALLIKVASGFTVGLTSTDRRPTFEEEIRTSPDFDKSRNFVSIRWEIDIPLRGAITKT
jgi:hypothetical protein